MLAPPPAATSTPAVTSTAEAVTTTELNQSRESIDDESAFSDARSSPPAVDEDNSNHGNSDNTPVLGSILATEAVRRAWCLIHRASLWIGRDANGTFQENAIEKALADLDEALPLVGKS